MLRKGDGKSCNRFFQIISGVNNFKVGLWKKKIERNLERIKLGEVLREILARLSKRYRKFFI